MSKTLTFKHLNAIIYIVKIEKRGEKKVEIEQAKAIIEAILFSAGRVVETKELMAILELSNEDIDSIIQNMKAELEDKNRGIEIIKVDNGYQMTTKTEYYDYIYPIFDNRAKPTLSAAALETLSIIAYNPKITRAEIEQISRN